jgi:hypothetical protein
MSYGSPATESPSAEAWEGGLLARIAGNDLRTVIVETYRCGGRRASEGRQTYAERKGGQELVALPRQSRGYLNGPPLCGNAAEGNQLGHP